MDLIATDTIHDTQNKRNVMLSVVSSYCNSEYCCAGCCYVECLVKLSVQCQQGLFYSVDSLVANRNWWLILSSKILFL